MLDRFVATRYFDFDAHPFAHRALFDQAPTLFAAIRDLQAYLCTWLATRQADTARGKTEHLDDVPGVCCHGCFRVLLEAGAWFAPCCIIGPPPGARRPLIHIASGAHLTGCTLDLRGGDIHIGRDVEVQPFAGIHGPCVLGAGSRILQGALLRPGVLAGEHVCIRCEVKNAVLMDEAEFPHPGYLGDSLCGWRSHFGNQATAANLPLLNRGPGHTVILNIDGARVDTGLRKIGIVMGDEAQLGCGAVTDPGTFLGPRTIVYPLTRLPAGCYGPDEIIKNKPLEHGIIERAPLRPVRPSAPGSSR